MTKRKILLAGLGGLLIVAAAGAVYVRLSPMDPAIWHADPEAALRTGRPNDFLVGPGGDRAAILVDGPPGDVMARLDTVAMGEPGTERLAGTPGEGWATYVQRSALMGYPDAVSIRAAPEGGGTRLTIWSRSRYGQSDMGVNRARVERWLAALDIG